MRNDLGVVDVCSGGMCGHKRRPRGVRDRARVAERGARPRLRERREQGPAGDRGQAREGLAYAKRAQVSRSLDQLIH